MKLRQKKAGDPNRVSWGNLLRFYTKIRIPWLLIILNMAFSIVVKEAESQLVPFVTKIETGVITEHGFLLGFVLMTVLYNVSEIVQGSFNDLGREVMTRNVRRTVWGKLIRLPMSVFDRDDPQRLVSRVTQDTTGAYAAVTVLVQIISVGYGIYTNFVKMYRVYKMLALIMLTGIPLTFLSAWILGKLEYQINQITNSSYAALTNFFGERLPNLFHIKTCRTEDEEYKKGVEASQARYKAELRRIWRFIIQGPIMTMAQYLNMVVLLLVASAMVRTGTMKMAQMINLYNYYMLFMGNALLLNAIWQGIKGSQGACATIANLVNTEDEKLDGPVSVPEQAQDIEFEHVSFAYEEGRDVLKDVSFVIPHGKVTAIVGENGSGKSTLIKLLERFNDPSAGAIRLGGEDLKDVNLTQWRDAVGYLFQGDQMVKGSIRENICYGQDRECSQEEVEQAARLARAYDFIQAKEGGFDAEISRFDSKLSGGELQRLAIARIILKKPRYLIMDEATSGIDVVSEAEVMEGLNQVMAGKTVIMVSHDMKLASKADHIVVLDGGEVEASGTYEQVSAASPLFRRLTDPAPLQA